MTGAAGRRDHKDCLWDGTIFLARNHADACRSPVDSAFVRRHYGYMNTVADTITIDQASRQTGVSLGTLGYWIIAGMLEARIAERGRIVRLSDVERIADELGVPGARRDLLVHHGRSGDPQRAKPAPGLHAAPLMSELAERIEALDEHLRRIDLTLSRQVGSVDRLAAARLRDSEAIGSMQQTLDEHAAALRGLESWQARALEAMEDTGVGTEATPLDLKRDTTNVAVGVLKPVTPEPQRLPEPPRATRSFGLRLRLPFGKRAAAPKGAI